MLDKIEKLAMCGGNIADELQKLPLGSVITYTENDSLYGEEAEPRRVTYKKIDNNKWSGSDDIGDRWYAIVDSDTVSDVVYGTVSCWMYDKTSNPNPNFKVNTI